MNFAISRFTLDLQESQSQVSVHCLHKDTARIWLINLSDAGVPYTIGKGVSVALGITRPNGDYFESYCTVEQNCIKYDFSSSDLTKKTALMTGIHTCQIVLSYEEDIQYVGDTEEGGAEEPPKEVNVLATAAFTMVVRHRQAIVDDAILDSSDNAVLDSIRNEETARQAKEIERQDNEVARQNAEVERQRLFDLYMLSVPKIVSITLLASAWEGEDDPYSQVVSIEGVTENTKVDLQPSADQLAIFHDKDLAFVTENDGGIVTVYAIGDKPTQDYTIQATLKEVRE